MSKDKVDPTEIVITLEMIPDKLREIASVSTCEDSAFLTGAMADHLEELLAARPSVAAQGQGELVKQIRQLIADTSQDDSVEAFLSDLKDLLNVAASRSEVQPPQELKDLLSYAASRLEQSGNLGQVCADCHRNSFEMAQHSDDCITRKLRKYANAGAPAAGSAERRKFQEGEFVHVNNERFHGFGVVKYHTDPEPQGRVGVTLENGNTWDYLAETVTPADKGSGMCYGTCALAGTDTDVAKEK